MVISSCFHFFDCRYFHEIVSQPVVHRNFRSSNILLDDELNPHVSDCGLAAFTPSSAERQVCISYFNVLVQS